MKPETRQLIRGMRRCRRNFAHIPATRQEQAIDWLALRHQGDAKHLRDCVRREGK